MASVAEMRLARAVIARIQQGINNSARSTPYYHIEQF